MSKSKFKRLCLFCGERKMTDEVACYHCRVKKNLRYVPKHQTCDACWLLTIKAGGHLPFYKKDETRNIGETI